MARKKQQLKSVRGGICQSGFILLSEVEAAQEFQWTRDRFFVLFISWKFLKWVMVEL